ncbi:MAG: hypothetical protein Tsb002_11400 [Wenzhouxiangellaceae bacterium]
MPAYAAAASCFSCLLLQDLGALLLRSGAPPVLALLPAMMLLMMAVLLLRWSAAYLPVLGESPSSSADDDRICLVDDGPYAYCRHPMYLSLSIFSIANACWLHFWLPWLLAAAFIFWLWWYYVPVEESRLIQSSKGRYLHYQLRVGLLPRRPGKTS